MQALASKLEFSGFAVFGMEPIDLVYLILIVVHINQLAPELPKDACESRWQSSPEFKSDYAFAREAALTVVSEMQSRFSFINPLLHQAEDFLRDLCEEIETRLKQSGEAFDSVNVECLCGEHPPAA